MKKTTLFLMLLSALSLGSCAESTNDSKPSTEGESTPENSMDDMGTTTTGQGTTGTSGTPTIGAETDTTGTNMRDSIR